MIKSINDHQEMLDTRTPIKMPINGKKNVHAINNTNNLSFEY